MRAGRLRLVSLLLALIPSAPAAAQDAWAPPASNGELQHRSAFAAPSRDQWLPIGSPGSVPSGPTLQYAPPVAPPIHLRRSDQGPRQRQRGRPRPRPVPNNNRRQDGPFGGLPLFTRRRRPNTGGKRQRIPPHGLPVRPQRVQVGRPRPVQQFGPLGVPQPQFEGPREPQGQQWPPPERDYPPQWAESQESGPLEEYPPQWNGPPADQLERFEQGPYRQPVQGAVPFNPDPLQLREDNEDGEVDSVEAAPVESEWSPVQAIRDIEAPSLAKIPLTDSENRPQDLIPESSVSGQERLAEAPQHQFGTVQETNTEEIATESSVELQQTTTDAPERPLDAQQKTGIVANFLSSLFARVPVKNSQTDNSPPLIYGDPVLEATTERAEEERVTVENRPGLGQSTTPGLVTSTERLTTADRRTTGEVRPPTSKPQTNEPSPSASERVTTAETTPTPTEQPETTSEMTTTKLTTPRTAPTQQATDPTTTEPTTTETTTTTKLSTTRPSTTRTKTRPTKTEPKVKRTTTRPTTTKEPTTREATTTMRPTTRKQLTTTPEATTQEPFRVPARRTPPKRTELRKRRPLSSFLKRRPDVNRLSLKKPEQEKTQSELRKPSVAASQTSIAKEKDEAGFRPTLGLARPSFAQRPPRPSARPSTSVFKKPSFAFTSDASKRPSTSRPSSNVRPDRRRPPFPFAERRRRPTVTTSTTKKPTSSPTGTVAVSDIADNNEDRRGLIDRLVSDELNSGRPRPSQSNLRRPERPIAQSQRPSTTAIKPQVPADVRNTATLHRRPVQPSRIPLFDRRNSAKPLSSGPLRPRRPSLFERRPPAKNDIKETKATGENIARPSLLEMLKVESQSKSGSPLIKETLVPDQALAASEVSKIPLQRPRPPAEPAAPSRLQHNGVFSFRTTRKPGVAKVTRTHSVPFVFQSGYARTSMYGINANKINFKPTKKVKQPAPTSVVETNAIGYSSSEDGAEIIVQRPKVDADAALQKLDSENHVQKDEKLPHSTAHTTEGEQFVNEVFITSEVPPVSTNTETESRAKDEVSTTPTTLITSELPPESEIIDGEIYSENSQLGQSITTSSYESPFLENVSEEGSPAPNSDEEGSGYQRLEYFIEDTSQGSTSEWTPVPSGIVQIPVEPYPAQSPASDDVSRPTPPQPVTQSLPDVNMNTDQKMPPDASNTAANTAGREQPRPEGLVFQSSDVRSAEPEMIGGDSSQPAPASDHSHDVFTDAAAQHTADSSKNRPEQESEDYPNNRPRPSTETAVQLDELSQQELEAKRPFYETDVPFEPVHQHELNPSLTQSSSPDSAQVILRNEAPDPNHPVEAMYDNEEYYDYDPGEYEDNEYIADFKPILPGSEFSSSQTHPPSSLPPEEQSQISPPEKEGHLVQLQGRPNEPHPQTASQPRRPQRPKPTAGPSWMTGLISSLLGKVGSRPKVSNGDAPPPSKGPGGSLFAGLFKRPPPEGRPQRPADDEAEVKPSRQPMLAIPERPTPGAQSSPKAAPAPIEAAVQPDSR